MVNPSRRHLRIHVEDPHRSTPEVPPDIPAIGEFLAAYQQLTGWPLTCHTGEVPSTLEPIGSFLRSVNDPEMVQLCLPQQAAERASEQTMAACQMGESVARILAELQTTRRALQHREAELATAVPVVAPPEEASQLNQRLQAILRGAVEGFDGTAAALYLLDDATSQLKLRSQWGLPSLRFVEPARALRGAVADLEALTGHAVVLEDTQLLPHWNVPEDFAAAVCVPVASPGAILGTFWLFCRNVRDFTPAETQLLEILAGRLAAELERSVLVGEVARAGSTKRQAEQYSQWHEDRNHLVPPLLDGWQVSAAGMPQATIPGDFHFWRLTEDARLLLAAGGVQGAADRRVLSAALLRGALQAQVLHDTDPCRVLQHLNEVLCSSSPGDEAAALFVGRLDLVSGQLESCSAGSTDAYILRPHGWEPIVRDTLGLGTQPEVSWLRQSHHIAPGDVLLAMSDRDQATGEQTTGPDTTKVAETLLRHIHLRATELAQKAAQLIQQQTRDSRCRSVVVVKRSDNEPSS